MTRHRLLTLAALVLALLSGCATAPHSASQPAAGPDASALEAEVPNAPPLPAAAPLSGRLEPRQGPISASTSGPASSSAMHASPGGESLLPITAAQASSLGVMQLSPPTDLWERMRRGFAMPNLESPLVHDREQWYATRPDTILRMTERSRKYLFHIVEELELRDMPTELALLPFVESAFNPQAVSSAKAAGMWQFIPSTGKSFDLKQNAFRDDRRDVLASTRAALDYLQKLYKMFGDWHLALAAYNWGEGSVGRAITRNQRANQPGSYTHLNMPMETRMYVPKLQAMKNIVANPEAFNSRLPRIDNHPYFDSVTITRDIDVALAAKLAEVAPDDFKALNPSLNRPVILAASKPQILLPWDNATVFQRNLEAFSGERLASWTAWIAPTTMKAADAAKRAGMSEADFRQVNNIPPRVLIKSGSTLLIPRSAGTLTDVTQHIADNGQMSLAPEVTLRRTVVKAGKNDSVATVARQHGVSAVQVANWNKVKVNSTFKAGREVVLFLPGQAAQPRRSATPAKARAKAHSAPPRVQVKPKPKPPANAKANLTR